MNVGATDPGTDIPDFSHATKATAGPGEFSNLTLPEQQPRNGGSGKASRSAEESG